MKLPVSKIELAASDFESRYTLHAVKLDVENKRIMATDGHILAIVPCEVAPEDHSALLSLEAVKNIRAMQKRSNVPVEIRTNGKATATCPGEVAEYELTMGTFPNVDMVVPKSRRSAHRNRAEYRAAHAFSESPAARSWQARSANPQVIH